MPQTQIQIDQTSYAWLAPIDEKGIAHRAAKKQSVTISRILFFVLFLMCLGLTGVLYIMDGMPSFFSITFWMEGSWTVVWFYFTLLAAALLFSYQQKTKPDDQSKMMFDEQSIGEIQAFDPAISHQDFSQLCSDDVLQAVEQAYVLASKFGHKYIEPLHLFVGALDAPQTSIVLSRLGITFESIQDSIGRRLQTRELGKPTTLGESAERALFESFVHATQDERPQIFVLDILGVAYTKDAYLQELFLDKGVDETTFRNMIVWLDIHERMRERYQTFQEASFFKPTGPMNRAMTSVATPMLDAISEDLTAAAVKGHLPFMVDREQEMKELFQIIEGGKQSVVLVGSEGVGKTTMLAGVAERMVLETVPDSLKDHRFVRLSIPHLISGANEVQAQERLLRVLSEVSKSRNIILAITDIDQLLQPSTQTLASTLVDFLSRSGTFVVATTIPQKYTEFVEQSVFGRVFQKVDINEPDQNQSIHMLQSKIGGIEHEHNVVFTYKAVEQAVSLSHRFMHETYLPKKAIDVAQQVALAVAKERGANALVTEEDVAKIVTEKTGVPNTAVKSEEKDVLLHLEDTLHKRVIGQDEAVKAVSSALRRARTQLTSQQRPIAAFLFLGPTGVGKTELAKAVSQTYFGSEEGMIRLDMSEYQEPRSIERLIGAPGTSTPGLLTESVRKQPFSLVLLDEFEKAHPDILNIFLQVFDDGRLTDVTGRTIDFTNTIIIATSNAGTAYIQKAIEESEDLDTIKTHLIEDELSGIYRPELLNRFDGIIVFKPLTQDDVQEIAKIFIAQVSKKLEPKGIHFRAQDEAIVELAQKGFDPAFGARPLRRVIQEEVDNAIANALLEGNVKRRDTIVLEKGGTISIEKAEAL